ncbi:MAG: cytochrome b/b6 domain-containing protein [Methylocella sp.]
MGTAARTGSAPRLLCPHRGDDRIGLAHGLGVAAAATSAPSRRLRRAQSHPPGCAAGGTEFVHEAVSKLLIAAILLHVAAALKHHFADKDTVLLRMLPFYRDNELARRQIIGSA